MSAKKRVSAFSLVEIIVIVLLVLIIAFMAVCNIVFRNDGEAKNVFGYSFYRTRAVNMIPEIPVNTIIVAKISSIPDIHERSVVICKIGERTTLTRVVSLLEENGSTSYIVKFDTSPDNETFRIESKDIIAKAEWQMDGAFLNFATSPVGIVIAIIIPLLAVIIFQVVRIRNIKALEQEASSLDDFDDDAFNRRRARPEPNARTSAVDFEADFAEKNEKPDVVFTSPRVAESEAIRTERYSHEIRPIASSEAPIDFNLETDGISSKAKLTVDKNGRADYKITDEKPAAPQSPLYTYDKLTGRASETAKQPATVGAASDSLYVNPPTKIEQPVRQMSSAQELLGFRPSERKPAASTEQERVVFTPHLSNIIPESIANVQAEAAHTTNNFDESVKAYFEKSEPKVVAEEEQVRDIAAAAIPENAVIPTETIAPPKKKKNSKTLEELMSIIDSEESKLKK